MGSGELAISNWGIGELEVIGGGRVAMAGRKKPFFAQRREGLGI